MRFRRRIATSQWCSNPMRSTRIWMFSTISPSACVAAASRAGDRAAGQIRCGAAWPRSLPQAQAARAFRRPAPTRGTRPRCAAAAAPASRPEPSNTPSRLARGVHRGLRRRLPPARGLPGVGPPLFRGGARLAIVQSRWEHINAGYSALTKAIALGIDVHFLVEQPARSAAGLFLNFNGSGGIIRRSALVAAGGWQGDTLAEDLDMSYGSRSREAGSSTCATSAAPPKSRDPAELQEAAGALGERIAPDGEEAAARARREEGDRDQEGRPGLPPPDLLPGTSADVRRLPPRRAHRLPRSRGEGHRRRDVGWDRLRGSRPPLHCGGLLYPLAAIRARGTGSPTASAASRYSSSSASASVSAIRSRPSRRSSATESGPSRARRSTRSRARRTIGGASATRFRSTARSWRNSASPSSARRLSAPPSAARPTPRLPPPRLRGLLRLRRGAVLLQSRGEGVA